MTNLTFGSLFAGIGGFDLGFERAGMTCKWQVEIDDYCNKVLAKHWPDVRRYKDVKEIHGVFSHPEQLRQHTKLRETEGQQLREGGQTWGELAPPSSEQLSERCPTCLEPVDVICGGFPCQPHSVAGKRRGADDDRNLWPEFLRIVREVRPAWVVAENVPGIVSLYLDTVLSDLEGEGYTCWTFNIPACAFDAPHRRERIFVVAHRLCVGRTERTIKQTIRSKKQKSEGQDITQLCEVVSKTRDVANTTGRSKQSGGSQRDERRFQETILRSSRNTHDWTVEPSVGRVAHGIPARVDRLRALGNAVVPQVAEWIGRRIVEVEHGN